MNNYFLYIAPFSFFNTPFVVALRIIAAITSVGMIIIYWWTPLSEIGILLSTILLINEIFIHLKLYSMKPPHTVKTAHTPKEAAVLPVLAAYSTSSDGYSFVKKLSHLEEVKYIYHKIGAPISFPKDTVLKENVLQKAFEIVEEMGEDYITPPDIITSYLVLTEDKSHFLEKYDLDAKDILNVLHWTKHTFEQKNPPMFSYRGGGYGEFIVYGWNAEIQKYAEDYTSNVVSIPHAPSLVGRKEEYDQFISVLSKEHANSVLLVGYPGVGKSSIISLFAYNSFFGITPSQLSRKRVYEVFVDRILAGAGNQGELEKRLDEVLTDIEHSGNAILLIHNMESIFGGGGFGFDASGVLFQYLKNSRLQIVGTCTPENYKTYIEKQTAVFEYFDEIRVEEPDEQKALFMLFEKIPDLERAYKKFFTYTSVVEAVHLSSSYLLDSYLPGKAINLLEDVASSSSLFKKDIIEKSDVVKKVEEKTKVVLADPTKGEREILLNLENELHKRVIGQEEAIFAVSNAIRRLRSGFVSQKRPISVLLFLGPTGVGKTETAKALANVYFGKEGNMIRLDMSELQTPDSIKRILGGMPGESDSTQTFLDEVAGHPFSLVLLDEFEKAYPKILDIFLQIFEDGRATNNNGKVVSFINTIIIATSNAGSELIRQKITQGSMSDAAKDEILNDLQVQNIFKPELLNRFDEIILFTPLSVENVKEIARLILAERLLLLESKRIHIRFDEKIIDKIVGDGFSPAYGARNIRRFIEHDVESVISKLILEGTIKKGDEKNLTVDSKGQITVV